MCYNLKHKLGHYSLIIKLIKTERKYKLKLFTVVVYKFKYIQLKNYNFYPAIKINYFVHTIQRFTTINIRDIILNT